MYPFCILQPKSIIWNPALIFRLKSILAANLKRETADRNFQADSRLHCRPRCRERNRLRSASNCHRVLRVFQVWFYFFFIFWYWEGWHPKWDCWSVTYGPRCLYCCESWTISKDSEFRLQSTHGMLKIKWKDRCSNEVLPLAGISIELIFAVATRQIRFAGHVLRKREIGRIGINWTYCGQGNRRVTTIWRFWVGCKKQPV